MISTAIGISYKVNDRSQKLCTIYFADKGKTLETLKEINRFIQYFRGTDFASMTEKQAVLAIIRYYESRGGGVDADDLAYMQCMFPGAAFRTDIDQNCGKVAVTKASALDAYIFADHYSFINVADMSWWMGAYDYVDDAENVGVMGPNLAGKFQADDLPDLMTMLKHMPDVYRTDDNEVIRLLR